MSLLPVSFDYSAKDFDALRTRLTTFVQAAFPDWSDFSVASFGNIMLEMFAFVGDVLTFYLDNQARESRLVSATQRKNVIALARMLGYKLHGAQAATAELEVSLLRPPAAEVLIPAGTVVRTQEVAEPVRFQLLSDAVITTGANPPITTVVAEHSKSHTQVYDARGLANLDITLDHTPYLDGSLHVSAANGDYEAKDSLLGSGPNDRHFTALVDQSDRATVRFGNGVRGAPPDGTIRVSYKTGGGAAGNVDAGSLVVVEGAFRDAHGRAVQVRVNNPQPASGGTPRQSIESAKLLVPESLRVLSRSVTREDFEINARRVPGVARALMLSSNEDPTIDENSGILFVVPEGGGLPTTALKAAVHHMVTEEYPCTLTFHVAVQNPVYRSVDVEATIYLEAGSRPDRVAQLVRGRLGDMFRLTRPNGMPNPLVDFGFNLKDGEGRPAGEMPWSYVLNVIHDTLGVRKIGDAPGDLKLNGQSADVVLGLKDFPVLGTVTLFNGDSGEEL